MLDWWAKNNDCYKNMLSYRTVPIAPSYLVNQPVVFSVDGENLAFTYVEDFLYSRTFGKRTLAYWRNRRNHTEAAQNHIQWDLTTKVRNSLPTGLRWWHVKYVSGHLPTSQVLCCWRKHQEHSKCPRCDGFPETQNHVLQCQAPSAINKWQESLDKLQRVMEKEKTHPGLSKAILHILSS